MKTAEGMGRRHTPGKQRGQLPPSDLDLDLDLSACPSLCSVPGLWGRWGREETQRGSGAPAAPSTGRKTAGAFTEEGGTEPERKQVLWKRFSRDDKVTHQRGAHSWSWEGLEEVSQPNSPQYTVPSMASQALLKSPIFTYQLS